VSNKKFTPMPDKLMDFRSYLYLVWQFLHLPPPTRFQYDIANYLQAGPKRKVIEAFRGIGKSWITSAYVTWRLRINPLEKFLVISASKTRADDFTTFTLRLIHEMPLLQPLIPNKMEGQRMSKIAFDVGPSTADHAPSVKSVGVFGQLSGTRADEIVADDVEVPNNSMTETMRERLSNAVKEFDAILKPNGKITYLGTPQCEQSLYNVLRQRGYSVRVWPARYPNERYKCDMSSLAPIVIRDLEQDSEDKLAGTPTDPNRFNDEDLMERELSYGRSGFALQFMLDTSLSDAERYPLRLSDLIIHPVDTEKAPEKLIWGEDKRVIREDLPNVGLDGDRLYGPIWLSDEWIDFSGSILAIDPSGRGKDELAYAVIKMLNGYLHVSECCGIRGEGYSDKTLEFLANLAKQEQVNKIVIEENYGDGMFSRLLTPHLTRIYPCTIEEVKNSKQKELRIIDVLEPVMNQHKLVIDPKVIRKDFESVQHLPNEEAIKYMLCHQMTRLTKERQCLKHDDRLDVLAIGVGYWVEQMGLDADKMMEQHKEQLVSRELEVFEQGAKANIDMLCMGMDVKGKRTKIVSNILH